MILPNVRAGFASGEVGFLLGLLSEGDARHRSALEDRIGSEGLDSLLDDPRTLNAVMSGGGVSAAPLGLACYLLVRHALLEHGLRDRTLADYVAALMVEFGRRDGSPEGGRYDYVVDIMSELSQASGPQAFRLQAHLGEFSLWLTGLFPDHLVARVHRRGAPGLGYYEEMGAAGYRLAAVNRQAGDLGLDSVYRDCAERFSTLRVALNKVSDRYLFPQAAPRIDRMLRQISDRFDDGA